MLVFIAAVRRELAYVEPLVEVRQRRRIEGCVVSQGMAGGAPVALVQCGIGKERAQAGARVILEECHPGAAISLGLGGGAAPHVKSGELVLAEKVLATDFLPGGSSDGPAHGWIGCDSRLLEAATTALQDTAIRLHRGDLLTTLTALGPAMKRRARETLGLLAVDMEAYWVGKEVAGKGVPFLAVRAIFDEVDDPLPEYERFVDGMGEVKPAAAALYLLRHPRWLARSPALARRARKASRALGSFASAILPSMRELAAEGARG